jgi:hypothetical protein
MTEKPGDNERAGNGPPDQTEAAAAAPVLPAAAPSAPPHRHRFLIGALFALATIIGVFAVLAVWANRQALNTDNWTNTSTQLLADKRIQTAVAAYSVNELFSSGVVQSELQSALPKALAPLAGPISGGLQQLAGQVAPKLLASSQVQAAWRQANRSAHQTLLKIINGAGSLATTNGGVVTLNLHAIVDQLAKTLGIQSQVAAVQSKLQSNAGTVNGVAKKVGVTLPPSSGQLVILRSSQLKTAQDVASGIKGLALVLPIITFVLFILAVWLSKGHRQQALRTTGWCFVTVGLFVLLARRLIGNDVVDSLVKNPSNKPAAHDVWTIGTTLLYNIGAALVVYGLVFVVAAWLGGHTRPAMALRRALAPTLRARPVIAYVTVFLALLLVVLWGPTPATRQVPYIIGIAVLLVLGVESLRRQTAREFADAQAADTMRSIRAIYGRRPATPTAPPIAGGANGGRVSELERLATLHDRGALTNAEFAAEKAMLVSGT